jgi:cyclase
LKNLVLAKSVKFGWKRPIGIPRPAVRVFNAREVDELILLDIDAAADRRGPFLDTIADLAEECFMPLTVGGGLRSVEDVRAVLRRGADKVSMNTGPLERPELITEVAHAFGSQCAVVSIDAKRLPDGGYEVFAHGGQGSTGQDPVAWARRAEELGAGEVLLTSIDRDGTMEGYDLELVRLVADAVSIPVIACGGAGTEQHFVDAVVQGHAAAVAASSIFQYTEVTPQTGKAAMRQAGLNVRI